MTLDAIYKSATNALNDLEKCLSDSLHRSLKDDLKQACHYVLASKGKRIRPNVLFCAHQLFGNPCPKSIKIASAIELIHTASLIHDDIIDEAHTRHQKPCFYRTFGMPAGITMGVYLYSLALRLIADTEDPHILRRISHAVKGLCIGEINQIFGRNKLLNEHQYLLIIKQKTAVLFGLSAELGGYLGGASKREQWALKRYGMALGMLFQLTDDLMDLTSPASVLGKHIGQDISQGEFTLPLLLLEPKLSEQEMTVFNTLLTSKDLSQLPWIIDKLAHYNIREEVTTYCHYYIDIAHLALNDLPQATQLESLLGLIYKRM